MCSAKKHVRVPALQTLPSLYGWVHLSDFSDFISYSYRFIHFIISTFLTFQRSTRHTKWTTFPPSCPAPGGALCPQPQAPASPSVKTTPCVQTTRFAVTTAAGSPVVGTKISPARALGTSGTRTCVGWTARPTATARGWRSAVWRPVGAPAHGPATTICLTLPTRRPASGPPSGRCPTSVANYETNLNGKNQNHSAIHCLYPLYVCLYVRVLNRPLCSTFTVFKQVVIL